MRFRGCVSPSSCAIFSKVAYFPCFGKIKASFPKIKSALKGTRFESVDAVKAKVTEVAIRKGPAALLATVENSHGAV
jgi:hypothetical protein